MANYIVSQYTTPTQTYTFPDDIDFTSATGNVSRITVTYCNEQGHTVLEKEVDPAEDIDQEHKNWISVYLSQEETGSFPKIVDVQVNWLIQEGPRYRRVSGEHKKFQVIRNNKDEVMLVGN